MPCTIDSFCDFSSACWLFGFRREMQSCVNFPVDFDDRNASINCSWDFQLVVAAKFLAKTQRRRFQAPHHVTTIHEKHFLPPKNSCTMFQEDALQDTFVSILFRNSNFFWPSCNHNGPPRNVHIDSGTPCNLLFLCYSTCIHWRCSFLRNVQQIATVWWCFSPEGTTPKWNWILWRNVLRL